MKNHRTKSTKAPQTSSNIDHKKSNSKLTIPTKTNQPKHLQPKKSSTRERVLSVTNLSKNNRHILSQSQLHSNNMSVAYIDGKQFVASTQYSKSKNKNISCSVRKSREDQQIRSNLMQTFKLLQHRLNIKEENREISTLGLSKSIYDIIKNSFDNGLNIPKMKGQSNGPTMNSFNNSGAEFHMNKQNIDDNINHMSYKQRKQAALKRVQNKGYATNNSSSLLEYFQQKFGSSVHAQDQQSLQRKLKMLQILKRSQDVASKCSSNYTSSINSNNELVTMGNKEAVIQKIKQKSRK